MSGQGVNRKSRGTLWVQIAASIFGIALLALAVGWFVWPAVQSLARPITADGLTIFAVDSDFNIATAHASNVADLPPTVQPAEAWVVRSAANHTLRLTSPDLRLDLRLRVIDEATAQRQLQVESERLESQVLSEVLASGHEIEHVSGEYEMTAVVHVWGSGSDVHQLVLVSTELHEAAVLDEYRYAIAELLETIS